MYGINQTVTRYMPNISNNGDQELETTSEDLLTKSMALREKCQVLIDRSQDLLAKNEIMKNELIKAKQRLGVINSYEDDDDDSENTQ